MLAVAVLTASSDDRIRAIDLYSDLMSTTRGRLRERIRNEIVRVHVICNHARWPFTGAPFSSTGAKVFGMMAVVVAYIPVQAWSVGNVLDRLLFTIIKNLKINSP